MKPSEWLEKHDWCKHYPARDKNGEKRGLFQSDATQFCILGAFTRVLNTVERDKFHRLIERMFLPQGCTIGTYNDEYIKTKEEAIEFLKKVENVYYETK